MLRLRLLISTLRAFIARPTKPNPTEQEAKDQAETKQEAENLLQLAVSQVRLIEALRLVELTWWN